MICELSQSANARALVYAQMFVSALQDLHVPVYPAKFDAFTDISDSSTDISDASTDTSDADEVLLPELSATKGSDIAFILHTSGSSSGSPKLVPCSYRWVDGVVDKLDQFCAPKHQNSQQVASVML